MAASLAAESTFGIPNTAPTKPQKLANARLGFMSLGKYREIIIAVALFLLFDLGVLVLNFYTSYQISEDASAINLAGRQRMLSQRSTKAMYAVQERALAGVAAGDDGKELDAAVRLFDNSLRAFKNGGSVMGTDGKPVTLGAVTSGKGRDAVNAADVLWAPFVPLVRDALSANASQETVKAATEYARTHNTALLGHMNALTTALEAEADKRASNLRMVQTIGIALALLNFIFILMKFIRRLRTSDAVAEAVAQENREILDSVNEGLFLLTPDLRIGSQIAKSSHMLFGKTLEPGASFVELLKPLVSEKTMQDATDYMGLLFSKHVKEQLVQGINPLTDVQVKARSRLGLDMVRHLAFSFYRARTPDGIGHLLVSVQDISERKTLQLQLEGERSRAQKEFNMLISAVEADPVMLRQFVQRSEQQLLEVNDMLRSISTSSSDAAVMKTIDTAFRHIHSFKGDASMLGLKVLATQAHEFESALQTMRDSGVTSGDALLALPLPLDDLLSKVAAFKEISKRRGPPQETAIRSPEISQSLENLAQDVAASCGKTVSLLIDLNGFERLGSEQQSTLQEVAVQLVRNAVVHGIEAPNARLSALKPAQGEISVRLSDEAGQWTLAVRDDGAGLSATKIRERLASMGWYSDEALRNFSDKQVIAHIFRAGFSSLGSGNNASMHAGRGVGLDVVQSHAREMGGRVLIATRVGFYTEFKLVFTA